MSRQPVRVHLIAERGTFPAPISINTPPGIPTGPGPARLKRSVITPVVDARTGRSTDGSLANDPDLARIGRVTTLMRG